MELIQTVLFVTFLVFLVKFLKIIASNVMKIESLLPIVPVSRASMTTINLWQTAYPAMKNVFLVTTKQSVLNAKEKTEYQVQLVSVNLLFTSLPTTMSVTYAKKIV
jgi:hypothetical protein